MTEKEAIQMLERMIDPDPWEDNGLSDNAKEALQMGIDALEKQRTTREMLEDEEKRYCHEWKRTDLSRGRISAFHDALRIDYSD